MKHIYNFLFVALMSLSASSQTTLPYYSGFDNTAERAGWSFYNNAVTQFAEWKFTLQAYTTPTCLSHNYPVGGTQMTMDWAVSPVFDFSAGGKIDSIRTNFGGFTTVPPTSDTIAIYLIQGSQNPNLATTKTLLFDFRGANYINDNTWRKFTNIIIPATPGQSRLAIYYKTVASWLDVKFDNLQLSANPSAPTASFSSTPAAVCLKQALVFNDLSTQTPTAWNWTFQGGTPSVSAVKNPTVTFASAGIYTVTLVSSNAVGSSAARSETISINACTGISSQAPQLDVSVYPNPTNGKFSISSNEPNSINFTLFNLLGEKISEGKVEATSKTELQLESWPAGIYFLTLENKSSSQTIRLLKN